MNRLYPSYFKLQVCWPRSFTRITYFSKLIGIFSLAAFLHLEIYWIYLWLLFQIRAPSLWLCPLTC
ncbi:hypothetical protein B4916_08960 [Yersinia intermedia]|nr:hypothetical protein B4916_08960 [Yersinia intermedia]